MLTGVALLGLGVSLIARSLTDDDDDGGLKAFTPGERNANASVPYRTGTRIEKAFTIERSADETHGPFGIGGETYVRVRFGEAELHFREQGLAV